MTSRPSDRDPSGGPAPPDPVEDEYSAARELEAARHLLARAGDELERWQSRLRDVAARLPDPAWDDDTGEPTNLAAAWKLAMGAHVDEPLEHALRWLRRAARWTPRSFGD